MGGHGVAARLAVGLSLVLAFGVVAGPVHAGPLTASRATDVVATAGERAEQVAPARAVKVAKPVVKRVKPSSGPTAGGTVVKIKGKRLVEVKKVLFGTTKGTDLRVKNPRKVIVVAPAHAAGQVAVRVVTKAGRSKKSRKARFTFVAAPTVPASAPVVTGLDPDSGPAAGGTVVDISGSGLSGTTSVSFGGVSAPFTVLSDTAVRTTSPAHAAGAVPVTVPVTVQTPAGTSTPVSFTYQAPAPPPVVLLVSPLTGPVTGGTAVTITGTGFTGATAVEFDGTPATSFTVDSDTQISATTPAHAAGLVSVSVTTPVDTSTVPGLFTYVPLPPPPPVVVLVLPATGPPSGGTAVTITGTGFTGATSVEFGGTAAASFTVDSDTAISATTPAHAIGPVTVSVTTPGGTSAVPGLFVYLL